MRYNILTTIWDAKSQINNIGIGAARFSDFDRAQMDLILDKVNVANAALSELAAAFEVGRDTNTEGK